MNRKEEPKNGRPSQITERERPSERPAKRSRSASYSSVSTISTSRSRSRSRSPLPHSRRMQSARETAMDDVQDSVQPKTGTKRGRSYSASPSVASSSRSPPRRISKINRDDRNTRRRIHPSRQRLVGVPSMMIVDEVMRTIHTIQARPKDRRPDAGEVA